MILTGADDAFTKVTGNCDRHCPSSHWPEEPNGKIYSLGEMQALKWVGSCLVLILVYPTRIAMGSVIASDPRSHVAHQHVGEFAFYNREYGMRIEELTGLRHTSNLRLSSS